ncbi:chromosomal replication initiation ATPase DnaA [Pseudochelatococcus lubricantis]|uniref:Chromosomal replication initiation ATPase DnaA n=1 Tax=Pseudochelatococcus lubricantis TaxID=1538102 RepID=A0ABX0UVD7_9HYPH|nr:helix-turn-helix domain-containing protein [Pseudochelatococcus lubricantis]NIJ56918.1 chromosomal replication initiation ATPase DnaA [Pseudochelatococcus lubricantis]
MSWTGFDHGGAGRLLREAAICRQCEAAVSSAFAVSLAAVRAGHRRRARDAFARAGAIYLARTGFNLAESAAGRAFGRHRATIGHACRRVAQRCGDDPHFRHVLSCLEHALTRRVARCLHDAAEATAAPEAGQ